MQIPPIDGVAAEARLPHVTELRADRRARIARGQLDLRQRAPHAVAHQVPDPPELQRQPAVIPIGLVVGAIEARRALGFLAPLAAIAASGMARLAGVAAAEQTPLHLTPPSPASCQPSRVRGARSLPRRAGAAS